MAAGSSWSLSVECEESHTDAARAVYRFFVKCKVEQAITPLTCGRKMKFRQIFCVFFIFMMSLLLINEQRPANLAPKKKAALTKLCPSLEVQKL